MSERNVIRDALLATAILFVALMVLQILNDIVIGNDLNASRLVDALINCAMACPIVFIIWIVVKPEP